MPIQVLDQETINQIAAGEVVERPASVVKELMENAIDAGATAVTAEIRDGGIGFIRITDNGCGIRREELPLAFLRHSTSKIKNAADLVTVASLGFRGEALSSIAAVSQVELITKTADSLTGSRYRIEGGVEKGLEEVGAPDGTTFISRNLFFNTPARRKFLKTAQTEAAHVADLAEKIALSHPEISVRLIINGQNKLHTSGNHNLKDIIYTVYGREIAGNLLPVEISNEILQVHGYIGKPLIARGNRNFENYFINGRYIRSGLISKAIEDGYKSYMMQHKYPFTLLHITVEPEYIDVNVHPSKMELRFKDGETIYRAVYQGILAALSHRELIPQVGIGKESEARREEQAEAEAKRQARAEIAAERERAALAGALPAGKHLADEHPEPFESKRRQIMEGRFIGETAAPYRTDRPYGDRAGQSGGGRLPSSWISAETLAAGSRVPAAEPVPGAGTQPAAGAASDAGMAPTAEVTSGAGAVSAVREISKAGTLPEPEPVLRADLVPEVRAASDAGEPSAATETSGAGRISAPGSVSDAGTLPEPGAVPGAGQAPAAGVQPDAPTPKMEQMEMFDDRLLSKKARYRHRLIGQVFDTYWLVEYKDQLYIIDQHAAHEKVLFEKNFATLKSREYTSQLVNPPLILTLSMQEADLLERNRDVFTEIGFEIESFGGSEYAVRAVPANLLSMAKKDLLLELLDGLSEDGGRSGAESVYDRIATMSCKAAVKGNNRLSLEEANELIDELLTLENPYNCPHGRPTIVAISRQEMEKKFKRIV